MTNEVSITVSVKDETGAGREKIVAEAEATGREAGAALSAGMQEASGAGGGGAVAGARSVQEEMSSVFQEIYQKGSNASFQLAGAMTAAWADIEAETKGLSAKEKQIFAEFTQILGSEGKDAAVAFATGQREATQAVIDTGAAAASTAPQVTGLGDAAASTGREMVFLSESARAAYEEQQRLWQAERDGISQFALFDEQDAPGMFTRIATTSGQSAAEVEQFAAQVEAATGQLELFTEAELRWVETTNMAQRPLTQAVGPSWGGPQPAPGEAVMGQWAGSGAEAQAAKVRQALLDDADAADQAKSSMGGLAGLMNGPLMQAFWGISSVAYLPMMIGQMIGPVTTWIQTMSGTEQAAQAAAMAQQSLGTAIAQDSNYIGDNTAATIQNILVKTNLADVAQKVGVTQATLIESVAGEAGAQGDLTDAYNKKIAALKAGIDAGTIGLDQGNQQMLQLIDEKNALDDLTRSTVGTLNTQRDQNQALLAAEQTTQIYTAAVDGLVVKQQLQAQQAKMNADAQLQYIGTLIPGTRQYTDAVYTQNAALQVNAVNAKIAADAQVQYIQNATVGSQAFILAEKTQQEQLLNTGYQAGLTAVSMLNLGDSQFNLNTVLLGGVDLYTRSASEAGAYNTVLTSLSGTMNTLLGSEAGFTIALDGVAKAAQANGLSLDVNNVNGAKNIQTFTQLATAADKAAVAVYQNEVQTQGSVKAYDDANAKLAQEKQAFIDAADKAGFNKGQVQQLADELYKLPDHIDTTVNVNTQPGISAMAGFTDFVQSEIADINNTPVVPQVFGGGHAYGGIVGAAAVGGPRGNLVELGENGRELVRLPIGSSVVPNANVNAMEAAGWGDGGGQRVQIEFVGDFFELIRSHVRVRGGTGPKSVQIAFGQTY